jgi:hypothetical protein
MKSGPTAQPPSRAVASSAAAIECPAGTIDILQIDRADRLGAWARPSLSLIAVMPWLCCDTFATTGKDWPLGEL